ncbi:AraC family transcriptional regulator [Pontixanthobacter sp. CEM42]|uniref:helix-turn-helix domain-containing protein n=1 Tax=Pontixanthobacter sp. CEM42 TaxID=2792077 RepID=UPI001ADF605A|nr:AraC family transcriptional regulator [Pontixanthobacter sp. CEM42]
MDGFEHLAMNWRSALVGLTMVCSATALIYLARRGIERRAIGWLAVFVIAANVSAIPLLIGFAGAYDIWPGLTFLPTQTALFFGPAVALHARALMIGSVDRRLWWLFTPGIAYWIYQLWAFTMLGDYRAKWAFNDAVHEPYILPVAVVGSWILAAGCLAYVWQLRTRYLQWLQDHHSDDERFSPIWLTHLVVLAGIVGLFWAIEGVLARLMNADYPDVFIWEFIALFAIFIIVLEALAGIDRPFPKMKMGSEKELDKPSEPAARDWVLEGTRLKAQVLEHKWHLEAGLSLQVLARRFGMNQAYLSRAINQGLKQNFSGFINGLRIEHAKGLIKAGNKSMIDIALSTGFGSKASFNRAFKLHTGTSPSEYRAAQQAK